MITVDDVKALAEEFWNYVKSGQPGDGIRHLFINPGVLLPTGELCDLEQHQDLHRDLCDESHEWITLSVNPVSSDPERVHATGVVAWEASFKDGRPGRIKTEVTENWYVERCADGQLRWTHYASTLVSLKEGSAELAL